MADSVKLSEIVERMDSHTYWTTFYLNKETGEIIPIMNEEFCMAKNLFLLEEQPDGKQDIRKIARDILDGDEKYIRIPSKFDIDEFSIMERFCFSIEDDRISKSLSHALKGKFAVQNFKQAIIRLGVVEEWYGYRNMELRIIAKKWCEKNDIDFTEDI